MAPGRISVLVAAAGAGWEAAALQQLGAGGPGIVLLKRCVDLRDLLATASTGQTSVAVVGHALPGLDADSVDRLRRAGVGVVLVAEASELSEGAEARLRRLGIEHVVDSASLGSLNQAVVAADTESRPEARPEGSRGRPASTLGSSGESTAGGTVRSADGRGDGWPDGSADGSAGESADEREPGRIVAVWGPTGAPGRTTLAVGLASELAHRHLESFLVDVDGFGGAVAQHLGVLDEMSGLLAAARMANAGQLDHARLNTVARAVNPCLRVLTGLPRADRWSEVREGAFEQLLELARGLARYVVLDTAFSLEEDVNVSFGSGAPQRNGMTLAALEQADEVVVVGSADPVGLARLARGMVELLEAVPGCSLRVAVNRTRASLGWGEKEVRAMIEGFVTPQSMHFLPEDRVAADRALMAGRSLVELGDSALRRAVSDLADAVTGRPSSSRSVRRRFGSAR